MSVTGEWIVEHEASRQSVSDCTVFPANYSQSRRRLILLASGVAGSATALFMAFAFPEVDFVWATLGGVAFLGGLLSTWSPCGYSSLSLLRPVGYSTRAVLRWSPTLAAHGVGYAVGAMILGTALALIGAALGFSGATSATLALLAVVSIVYGAHQLDLLRAPYPQRRAQVPHDARQRFPMWVIGGLYGLSLGLNYLTYVQTPLLYVVTLAAFVSGDLALALGLFALFNLGRFLPLLVNAAPVRDHVVQAWMARNQERAAMIDGAILVALGAGFGVLALV